MDAIQQLEQSVIGAVLIHPDTLSLLPTLETQDFQNWKAQTTWNAIRNLEATRAPIDVTTVGDEIAKMGKLEAVGFDYLGECALSVPTTSNAIEYSRRLKDNALRRRLVDGLADVVDAGRKGAATGAEMLSEVLAITSRMDAEQPEDAQAIGVLVQQRLRDIERQEEERRLGLRTLTGFPTGIEKLDGKIGGWQPGIVSIIAARPAMGKSSLGLATADACSKGGFGVHLFSLEDTQDSYADRAMSRESQVPSEKIRRCDLQRGEMDNLQVALRTLGRRQGWLFDGRSGITAEEIVRSVRRRKKDNKTKVVIVDYIQLVKKPHARMSTHESLGEIITTLADAAKHDGMAYVVMSQLNREIEKREDKRPLMSDLRESGSLEERSKCVVGIYRGAAYGSPVRGVDYECSCPPRGREHFCKPPSEEDFASRVELHLLKNSNGQTGKVTVSWHGPTTRME